MSVALSGVTTMPLEKRPESTLVPAGRLAEAMPVKLCNNRIYEVKPKNFLHLAFVGAETPTPIGDNG